MGGNLQLWIVFEYLGEERNCESGGKIIGIVTDPHSAVQIEAEDSDARWVETWKLTDFLRRCESKKIWDNRAECWDKEKGYDSDTGGSGG